MYLCSCWQPLRKIEILKKQVNMGPKELNSTQKKLKAQQQAKKVKKTLGLN